MRQPIWFAFALLLAGCGGGDKSAATMSVACGSGMQLVGATSIDVLGDLTDGRPTMKFPDPANAGQVGIITVRPHDQCKITPGNPSAR